VPWDAGERRKGDRVGHSTGDGGVHLSFGEGARRGGGRGSGSSGRGGCTRRARWRGWATPAAREKGERGGRAGSAQPRPWRAVAMSSATRGEEEGMERGRGRGSPRADRDEWPGLDAASGRRRAGRDEAPTATPDEAGMGHWRGDQAQH
jgi:hypothetical protein